MDKDRYTEIMNAKSILCQYCGTDDCDECQVQIIADDTTNAAIAAGIIEDI